MGVFDSECAITGLSLATVGRVACVSLAYVDGHHVVRGEVVLGPSDRAGSIDAPALPARPFALVAAPVWEAIVAHAGDPQRWLAAQGIALEPTRNAGSQHTSGDVLNRHVRAVNAFAHVAWMQAALDTCAALAEQRTASLLSTEAPPARWLVDAASSWYGVVIGSERRASTTLRGLRADIEQLAPCAFDPKTLRLERHLAIVAVVRGVPTYLDLRPALAIVNAGERAALSDRVRAEAINERYDVDDPRFELDWDLVCSQLPALVPPLAREGCVVFVGSAFGDAPSWADRDETAYGLTRFATVVAEGYQPPAPVAPSASTRAISDDEIEVELRAGRLIPAIRLYREKTGAGLGEAKRAIDAWRARL